MTKEERKKTLHDKAILQRQMVRLNRCQRILARGILLADVMSMRALATMLEFAGESETTNVLVEAGYQELSEKAQKLALRMTESSSVTKEDEKERCQLQKLSWFQKGTHVLRPVVVPPLLLKATSSALT